MIYFKFAGGAELSKELLNHLGKAESEGLNKENKGFLFLNEKSDS